MDETMMNILLVEESNVGSLEQARWELGGHPLPSTLDSPEAISA